MQDVFGSRHPPDAHAVLTGGGDALAVGEECHAPDCAGVALVFVHLLAALRIPDAHDAVTVTSPSGDALPAGDNALAVGRERGAIGSAASGVRLVRLFGGLDLLQQLARLDVPDLQRNP